MSDYTELLTKLESPLWSGLGIAELTAKAIRELQSANRGLKSYIEGQKMDFEGFQSQIKELEVYRENADMLLSEQTTITTLAAQVKEYDNAIQRFLNSEYPHPRSYRPDQCPHAK